MRHLRGGIFQEGIDALKAEPCDPQWPGLPKRLVSRITQPQGACGCWHVSGWNDGKGYAKMKVLGSAHYVHRVVFEFVHGPDCWDGNILHHLCYNRDCCNPFHVVPTTVQFNTLDGDAVLYGDVPFVDYKNVDTSKLSTTGGWEQIGDLAEGEGEAHTREVLKDIPF